MLSLLVTLTTLFTRLNGETCIDATPAAFKWTAEDHKIKLNGVEFNMKGTSWFGFETDFYLVHGLQYHSIDWYLNFLKTNKFNAIRVPFSQETFTNNPTIKSGTFNAESSLTSSTKTLTALDLLISKAASYGILIMLDFHSWETGTYTEGLYTSGTIAQKRALWKVVAQRYGDKWNIFMADLFNEPHDIAPNNWGTWIDFCENTGNDLINLGVNWLMAVQGTDAACAFDSGKCAKNWCNWGENLVQLHCGASRYVELNEKRVVYTPHVYGPSIGGNPYGSDVWNERWGFIASSNTIDSPVVLGEFGSKLATSGDQDWFTKLIAYLISIDQRNSFYWCLNFDSGDTEGLIKSDWTTPESYKLQKLDELQPNPTILTYNSNTNKVCGSFGAAQPTQPTLPPSPTSKPTPKPIDSSLIPITIVSYSATQQYWLEFNINGVSSNIDSVSVYDGKGYNYWKSGTYQWGKWTVNNDGFGFQLPLSVRYTTNGKEYTVDNAITSFGSGTYQVSARNSAFIDDSSISKVKFGDFENYSTGNWIVFIIVIVAIVVIIAGIVCFGVKKCIKKKDNQNNDYVSMNNVTTNDL